jgi:paraquat-inducible protein A
VADEAAAPVVATHPGLVVCEGCDAVYARQVLAPGESARCARCGGLLGRGHALSTQGQLALAVTALVVYLMATLSPIVTLDLRGVNTVATIFESIQATWQSGQALVAVLASATVVVFPLAVILLRLYVLAPMAMGRRPAGFVPAMRALRWFTRWSMVEVFMLGTLIALVRSAGLASAVPGVGVFSFGVLTLLLAANQAAGLHVLWQRAAELKP